MRDLGIGDSSDNDTFPTVTKWEKAKDNLVDFAFYRAATTGAWVNGAPSLREDSAFLWSSQKLDELGIVRFPYQWFDPRLSGEAQAKFFLSVLDKAGSVPTGEVLLDIEPAPNIPYTAWAVRQLKVWTDVVQQRYDVAIYTYPSFIDTMISLVGDEISWMSRCEYIVAHWDVTAPRVQWPFAPSKYWAWQYTANMPGQRYGFYGLPGRAAPKICMAVI